MTEINKVEAKKKGERNNYKLPQIILTELYI